MNPPASSDETLFAAALERPANERAAYLDAACAGDAARRARLEGLLRAHESAEPSFLQTAAAETPRAVEPAAGETIGRYHLLQKIGEGGCGTVYMAEQEEPVRRRVALKVIKLGMDTKEVIARFSAEQQALALMDHPNIARVFDAGATETGRPFFVMELVRGIPITKFCDEQSLPTAARLELFTQVCHAVQHAHQKGIIHRDLKPSNILVTLHDGVPVPKVIDFGIAKATQGRLTDATLFTAFEQFIGTPAYMSPEQAEMSGLDIDTRSDIYSLGVLLYELLTGRPPFDPKSLVAAGLDEIRRVIREVDPPRMSTRLSTLTDLDRATIAKQRATAPTKLASLIAGDLDWIAMKALEKDRRRRYESASAMAADIARYLKREPVIARPPTTAYLVRKLVNRHQLAFGAGGLVAAALVIGFAVATWSLVQERNARARAVAAEAEQSRLRQQAETTRTIAVEQRRLAEANEKRATSEANRSAQTFAFMAHMLRRIGSIDPQTPVALALREATDRTVVRLPAEMRDTPDIDGTVRGVLATVYLDLGEFSRAESLALESLERNLPLLGEAHPDVAGAKIILSSIRLAQRRVTEATALAREALLALQQVPPPKQRYLGAAHTLVGACLETQGRLEEAEPHLRTAIQLTMNDNETDQKTVRAARTFLLSLLVKQGRTAEAESLRKSDPPQN